MDYVQRISAQIDLVRPYLLRAGLKVSKIVFSGSKIQEASQEEIEKAYKWLTIFKEMFCSKIDKAYSLIPESQWKHYEIMGLTDTYEQNELKKAYAIVREQWIRRPDLLVTKKQEHDRQRKNFIRERSGKKAVKARK